jgi:3-oxoacyl-[acyl-carrier-protein] synthase II
MKRVVITGLGALTPIGNNLNDFWKGLLEGKSGAAAITKFDPSKFKTRFACELKGFDPLEYMDKQEVRKYDPYVQYAIAAVEQAIRHAELNLEGLDLHEVGVIWGTGKGGWTTIEQQITEFANGDGTPRYNPYFIPKALPNMASGIITIKYGFKGLNFTTASACAASNTSIMDAFNYIRWGKAKMIITGGSEASILPSAIGGFSVMKALSQRNDDPETASRPFDKDRDGFVMGEGAGAIILEEYEHAVNRGAKIIAEVAGTAMTSDAYHLSATHPEGEGAARAMRLALKDADLSPEDVNYINCHATSTPLGDVSETKAIANVFVSNLQNLKISATKSLTGHLLGAAGAIEAIASIKAIQEGIIPPSINVFNIDPEIPKGIQIVKDKPLIQNVDVAMSSTFGFGGHNAIAIFKKFQ